jgi:UDP:flavonoid glycosyltransferase YjiC (YdhE family)
MQDTMYDAPPVGCRSRDFSRKNRIFTHMNPLAEVPGTRAPHVLVCPLDWGLGHATRCVPLIRAFLDQGARVGVAADGAAMAFLKQAFPAGVAFYLLPGKHIRYPAQSGRFSMAWSLFRQFPGLLASVIREHRDIGRLVMRTGTGIVVSDNRYGCFSKKAVSVFVGHQIYMKGPCGLAWAEPLINAINHWVIRRYRHCWVPDSPGPSNLSGELSAQAGGRAIHPRLRFAGPFSRFQDFVPGAADTPLPDGFSADSPLPDGFSADSPLPDGFSADFYLVMLSGPEPQRTLLEEELIRESAGAGEAVVFVRGLVEAGKPGRLPAGIIAFDHLPDRQLAWLIKHARLVICRSGYSTLMDLSVFGKKVLAVPTPGQTEQEYLGRRIEALRWGKCVKQGRISLARQLPEAESSNGIPRPSDSGKALQELVRVLLAEADQ